MQRKSNAYLIHPAIYLEVFGLTILEALSIGRPMMIKKCGGPEELLRDDVDGYFVPPNDPTALTDKIGYVLRNPSD